MYEFASRDGEVVTQFHPISDPPPLGKRIVIGGKVFRRVVSASQQVVKPFKPYVAYSKPGGLPGCRVDPRSGRSIIETASQERAVAKSRGEEWS
jgi:hypothetical protein